MTYWNHRVVKKNKQYAIHEVYYDENDQIVAKTEEPTGPAYESLETLKIELRRMLEACEKEVVEY